MNLKRFVWESTTYVMHITISSTTPMTFPHLVSYIAHCTQLEISSRERELIIYTYYLLTTTLLPRTDRQTDGRPRSGVHPYIRISQQYRTVCVGGPQLKTNETKEVCFYPLGWSSMHTAVQFSSRYIRRLNSPT